MHTVLIANEKMTKLFRDYKRLFAPFLKDGSVCFCSWNEEAPDLETALPELTSCIGEVHAWRALIVHDPGAWRKPDGTVVFDEYNPYDYAVNAQDLAQDAESDIPLIRLTHMLAGYPDPGTYTVPESLTEGLDPDTAAAVQEDYLKQAGHARRQLVDKYDVLRWKPKELWMVCIRRKHAKPNRLDLEKVWSNRLESESSLFWQRNNYPDIARFMCFDMTDSRNGYYTRELFELWMTVLTLSLNKIPPSMLQAYRLYQVSCGIDRDVLKSTLLLQFSRLTQADTAVSAAMQVRTELSFGQNEDILTRQTVPVVLEADDGSDIRADLSGYGLSRDCPEEEMERWRDSYRGSKEALFRYIKAPRRAIDRAAEYTRVVAEGFFDEEYELDEIQQEELGDQIGQLEEDVLSAETMRIVDLNAYEDDLSKANEEVEDVIRGRMTRRATVCAGLIALVVYFCGFLPYLRAASAEGAVTFMASLRLTGTVTVCFAAAAVVLLFIFRHRLHKKMEHYNELAAGIMSAINRAAETFGEYLTLICTYMKGQSILQGAARRRESALSPRSLLRMHRRALREFKEQLMLWCAGYDIRPVNGPLPPGEEYYDFEVLPEDSRIYYLDRPAAEDDIMINTSGERISAPYAFVSVLHLNRLEVYEPERKEEEA